MGTIRVEVSHVDADHPEYPGTVAAHYGPAFDAAYAGTLQEITGVADVDLLAEAQKCAERFLTEHTGEDGWTARVVELVVDNPDDPEDEQTSSWVEVSA